MEYFGNKWTITSFVCTVHSCCIELHGDVAPDVQSYQSTLPADSRESLVYYSLAGFYQCTSRMFYQSCNIIGNDTFYKVFRPHRCKKWRRYYYLHNFQCR